MENIKCKAVEKKILVEGKVVVFIKIDIFHSVFNLFFEKIPKLVFFTFLLVKTDKEYEIRNKNQFFVDSSAKKGI